ncbi:MAG TPA: hypothetical protein EYH28_05870 [Anaerolineaceae bacterium]|nr:hypothetical protein [Anaerolineaceae bacterium]
MGAWWCRQGASTLALGMVLMAVVGSLWVATHIFEDIPHLEDEFAYLWEAQVVAQRQVRIPSPPEPKSFLVPFVIDHQGWRFGKYPLGWPVMLSFGVRWGHPAWVNALLAGLAVWLTFRLGERLWSPEVGLLAAALTLTSPFFWLNVGSLLSHPLGLVLSAAFALAWLDGMAPRREKGPPSWLTALTAGGALAALILTRPWTAVGVALPFGLWGSVGMLRGPGRVRRWVLAVGMVALLGVGGHLWWQTVLTGSPWTNPYTLWWPYDKVGFGPDVGRHGHTLHQAWVNTRFSLRVGSADLFGWGWSSWLFFPFGLWMARKNRQSWPVLAVFGSLVLVYLAYWVGAWLFGPRYYFEGLYSLTLLTALGVFSAAGWPVKRRPWPRRRGWRPLAVTALLALLVGLNVAFYLPLRLGGMRGLYTIRRSRLAPFLSAEAQRLTPALVIVDTEHWMPYGNLLVLEDPWLTTPWIFAWSRGAGPDLRVAQAFPDRTIIRYNPEEPYRFVIWRYPQR